MKTIMKRNLHILLLLVLLPTLLSAQGQMAQERKIRFGFVLDGDTVPYYHLKEVRIIESGSLLTETEIRKNQKLIRNVKKMLPYAKIGKQRLDQLERQVADMPKKQRKEAIKAAEKPHWTRSFSRTASAAFWVTGRSAWAPEASS